MMMGQQQQLLLLSRSWLQRFLPSQQSKANSASTSPTLRSPTPASCPAPGQSPGRPCAHLPRPGRPGELSRATSLMLASGEQLHPVYMQQCSQHGAVVDWGCMYHAAAAVSCCAADFSAALAVACGNNLWLCTWCLQDGGTRAHPECDSQDGSLDVGKPEQACATPQEWQAVPNVSSSCWAMTNVLLHQPGSAAAVTSLPRLGRPALQ